MQDTAKLIIISGVVMVLVGVVLFFAGKLPLAGKLPGDIFIKKDNFTFYFPIATCILLSIVFSIIMSVITRK